VRDEEGFTLIELMVVVLIIAILIAIAIPTFLGTRKTANDRAVASNVRNAFTAARTYYADKQEYTTDLAVMRSIEPSLTWTTTPLDGSQEPTTIYIEVQDFPTTKQTVIVVGRSKTGKCFYIRDVMSGTATGTHYQAVVPAGANCSVPLVGDPGWADAWTG